MNPSERRQLILDRLETAEELGTHDDDACLGILDDVPHLRCGETPIHRHANGTQLGEAADHLEELRTVLLDERDAIAETHTGCAKRLGGLAGPRVQLGERDPPIADDECGGFGPKPRLDAHDVGDGSDIGHVSY